MTGGRESRLHDIAHAQPDAREELGLAPLRVRHPTGLGVEVAEARRGTNSLRGSRRRLSRACPIANAIEPVSSVRDRDLDRSDDPRG